jgi:hypothetical protein
MRVPGCDPAFTHRSERPSALGRRSTLATVPRSPCSPGHADVHREPRGCCTAEAASGSEEPACAAVAGAPRGSTTTARGLRPHRCGRVGLSGRGDESPWPKARSRRAGEACFAIRGTMAPRRATAAASFRLQSAFEGSPEGSLEGHLARPRHSPRSAAQLHPASARRRVATSPSLASDLQPILGTRRFASWALGLPRELLDRDGCPPRRRTLLRSASEPSEASLRDPRTSSDSASALDGCPSPASARPPVDLRTFGGVPIRTPHRPSSIVSSRAFVGPSTHPGRMSPSSRAQRTSRCRSVTRGTSRSFSAMPPAVGRSLRRGASPAPRGRRRAAPYRPRVIPDVASSRAHLSVRTGFPGCETDGGRLPWGLGPFDASRNGQRLAPGLPDPATRRLQVFSTS